MILHIPCSDSSGLSRPKVKLLFLVAEDWYFCSHRLPLAAAAIEAGYQVSVVTRVNKHADAIVASGLTLIPLQFMRRSVTDVVNEFASIREILGIYRREKPDLVHQVGLKPVIYGSLAAHLVGVPSVVNALAGLGFIFSSRRLLAHILRPIVKLVFFILFKKGNSCVIVQNVRDREVLTQEVGLRPAHVRLIRGAGVDLDVYDSRSPSLDPPLVVLVSRMLWDKGVADFVEAATRIYEAGTKARFALIGIPDPENPSSVPESQLRAWQDAGKVEWWGFRDDIPAVLAMASVVCLPTFYGEGVPKALIEAMACRRAIVTSDIPGCRELVEDGRSGILVPPRNVPALTAALKSLILDPVRCREMGEAGRALVKNSLSSSQVLKETLAIYAELVRTKVVAA